MCLCCDSILVFCNVQSRSVSHPFSLLGGSMNRVVIRQPMYMYRNTEARSYSHCCSGKAVSFTYSECVFVDLGVQHAMHTRHFVICDLPRSTIFFPHCLLNGKIFEKTLMNTKYVFRVSLRLLSETFFILIRIERDVIKIYICWSSFKVPFILVILMKLEFS